MNKTLIVVGLIVLVILGYGWSVYNQLVTSNEAVNNQWAQVEVVLQRRFDLIPNLVGSVKGILTQEQKVFGDLAAAREHYAGTVQAGGAVGDRVAAANQVEGALGRLLVVMENYPQLRSVEAVTNLMTQLEGSENRVSVERQRFNDTVQNYNLLANRFPSSLIAKTFGFGAKDYFQAVAGATTTPKVDLTQ